MAWLNREETRPSSARDKALAPLLDGYSVEITARDVDAAIDSIPSGVEVFVANLPNDGLEVLVDAVVRLHAAGLVPVPHVVARNLKDLHEVETLIGRMAEKADLKKVLALGGDRDAPAGDLTEGLMLVTSGVFEKNGIRQVSLPCYPEGHPRIGDEALRQALKDKVEAVAAAGLEARLVSQFAFEAKPMIDFARTLRSDGIATPLRIGVAGPASTTKLIKYAMRCGVGASLRTLTERKGIAASLLGGETPEGVLAEIADAVAADPALGIEGVHFFTFGAPLKSVDWAQDHLA